ncbi:MAG: hypothetical protein A2X86_02320 [Bdellovibrionales bacterium GWA2_49_15]|nr:MAG: hypothetical protein A2X86_02320 [Bdellovibrionales bacterium GWA2_49_15]
MHILMLVLMLAFFGCKSDKNDVAGPSGGGGGAFSCVAGTPECFGGLNCEGLWQEELRNQPKGLMKQHRLDDKTLVDGRTTLLMSAEEKVEIVDATSETITKRVTFRTTYPGNSSTTKIKVDEKSKFLDICNKLGTNGLPLPSGTQVGGEILAQKDEFISVIAGTFDTQYVKIKSTVTVGDKSVETFFENWLTKEFKIRLQAKAIMQIPSTLNGKTSVMIKEMELMDFRIP